MNNFRSSSSQKMLFLVVKKFQNGNIFDNDDTAKNIYNILLL